MSAFSETLAWLYRLEAARGMDFKLERVALALAALGDPHRRFPCLHIAGTNGKGSVAAMLHAILQAAGHRAGLYTSPHLVRFTERIRFGDEEISEDEVVELTREIRTAATVRGIDLTFFEFVTVLAFLAFARHEVECAVIEVGLGGRLDATNVIDPEVAVITTIGLDHQQYLGETLEAIAAEKGGIIKPGRPVVLGSMPLAAKNVLRALAQERNAPCHESPGGLAGTAELGFSRVDGDIGSIRLALAGEFQRDNAGTALTAASLVRDRFGLTLAHVRRGLAAVRWPGRFEVVSTSPLVVVDGAHNEDGISMLVHELPSLVGQRPLHLLFGVMRDKDWRPMAERLGPLLCSATITSVLPPRGELPEIVAEAFRRHCPVTVDPDPIRALRRIRLRLTPETSLLVTGSLFLVGAVYPALRHELAASGSLSHP